MEVESVEVWAWKLAAVLAGRSEGAWVRQSAVVLAGAWVVAWEDGLVLVSVECLGGWKAEALGVGLVEGWA